MCVVMVSPWFDLAVVIFSFKILSGDILYLLGTLVGDVGVQCHSLFNLSVMTLTITTLYIYIFLQCIW